MFTSERLISLALTASLLPAGLMAQDAVTVHADSVEFLVPAQVTRAHNPMLRIHESDQAVDERGWTLQAENGKLSLRAANDAYNTSDRAYEIFRNGYAVDMHRWYEGGQLQLILDDSQLELVNGAKLNIEGLSIGHQTDNVYAFNAINGTAGVFRFGFAGDSRFALRTTAHDEIQFRNAANTDNLATLTSTELTLPAGSGVGLGGQTVLDSDLNLNVDKAIVDGHTIIDPANGGLRIAQKVINWTDSPLHPIVLWDYKADYDDYLLFASGGNTTIGNQSAMVVSQSRGLLFGKGVSWAEANNDYEIVENFRVSNAGDVSFAGSLAMGGTNVIDSSRNITGQSVTAANSFVSEDAFGLKRDVDNSNLVVMGGNTEAQGSRGGHIVLQGPSYGSVANQINVRASEVFFQSTDSSPVTYSSIDVSGIDVVSGDYKVSGTTVIDSNRKVTTPTINLNGVEIRKDSALGRINIVSDHTFKTQLDFYASDETSTARLSVQNERFIFQSPGGASNLAEISDSGLSLASGTTVNEITTDQTLGGGNPSDQRLATEKAVKNYVDTQVSGGGSVVYFSALALGGNVALANNSNEVISFTDVQASTHGSQWDGSVYTAPIDGLYHVTCHVRLNGINSARYGRILIKKGAEEFARGRAYSSASNGTPVMTASAIIPLSAGETFFVEGYQNNGNLRNIVTGSSTRLSVARVSGLP